MKRGDKNKLPSEYLPVDNVAPVEYGIVYIRVSTPGQEDGTSLGFQRARNLALAAALGVVIPPENIITEVWSAGDPERPGLRTVMTKVANREIQHVFVHDTDRLARDPFYTVLFIRHCRDHGVTLHFSDGTTVDSVLDEALQYFKGLFGYQEREKIAERTMNGKVETAKANRMPNGCGRGLYGYDYDPLTKSRSINEAEAVVVRQMFEWRLSGVSNSEIARRLNRAGIPTKTGGKWDPRTVWNMLTNEAFTGVQWWGKRRCENVRGGGRRITIRPREEWIQIVGFSPKIIGPAVFEAVQAAMESNARRGAKWDYFLGPFFYCGGCSCTICGATQEFKGALYPYYRCNGTLRGLDEPRMCSLRSIRADKLEPVVWEHVRRAVETPTGIVSDLRQASGEGDGSLDRRISRLEGDIKKRRLELATLVMQRTKGIIDQDMLENLAAPVNNLLAQHEKDLDLLIEQKRINSGWDELEEQVRVAFLKYADGLDSLDSEGRQQLMRLLQVRIVATPGRVLVTGVLDPSLFTTGQTLA